MLCKDNMSRRRGRYNTHTMNMIRIQRRFPKLVFEQ